MSSEIVLDHYFKQFLATFDPNLDVTALTPDAFRALKAGVPPGTVLPDASVVDKIIHTDQGDIALTITRPPGTETKTLPAILYLHGGGWVLGSKDSHALVQHELAIRAHAAVVFVNYDLSPEVKFPVPVEQCYASLAWLANKENAASLLIDVDKIAVAGDSAGGNLTAAVTLLAKQRRLHAIKFQILYYPVTNDNFDTPSYCQFEKGFYLTRDLMKYFWDHYIPKAERNSILACPLKAPSDDLKGLPPAYIVTVEADVLRDEGEQYAARLKEAGVDVVATQTIGMLHGFLEMSEFTTAAQEILDRSVQLLHKAWGQ
ncbi:hypothetical protein DFQ28_008521 [Apophysomyces sp. BC1034]|nr:hypothetical protein DFQ30_008275 [Apophysomyces sp. BC1015]KAG0185961.1 hypothetical protein DFQ28_008521 [Apophysomyces sp. BC1034]